LTKPTLRPRDKDTILQALAAGVVPRLGLPHIQVGRAAEIAALVRDIDRVADGGAGMRLVVGEYGAGKTFFLNLVRLIALERKCVTIHADLAPDRRLHATGGQARGLFAEAIRNMATRTKPEGGALASILERVIGTCVQVSGSEGRPVERVIDTALASMHDHLGGHDFVTVVKTYWQAGEDGDDGRKAAALRWLRAEYPTKTEARNALGVRSIIDDADVYDSFKLMAAFVRIAGYAGLVVVLDEMVNLYKLQSAQARSQNYEQLLRMLNDVLQGDVAGLGFVLGGTPEFLMDSRRGLYSYQALQSRLSENGFATGGLVDLSGPVVRLQSLTPEDLLVLLGNIRSVFASGAADGELVPDGALTAFMSHCNNRIGEAYFRTPRNTIKAFVQFLAVLEQNPGTDWRPLIGAVEVANDEDAAIGNDDGDDELATLRL
jgi:hypothetical protein